MLEIPLGFENNTHNNKMLGDLLKVFTVAVVREIINSNMNKTKMFSEAWVTGTVITLFGLLIFYLLISKVITFKLNEPTNKDL